MQTCFSELSLECQNVGCDRGNAPVVRNVSFGLSNGGALLVMGDNGAGKSSLLCAIAGRIPIAEGLLKWRSADEDLPKSAVANQIAILGHDGAIKMAMTVEENLNFWRKIYGRLKSDIDLALTDTGLSQLRFRRAGTLSAGQKRRLSFARILLANRAVWLLDEPTTSVDAIGKTDITRIIKDHLTRGGLTIIATHEELALKSSLLRLG